MPPSPMRFEPTDYAKAELLFLRDHLQTPPVVIKDMATLPPGVVRVQILQIITACYELEELAQHKGVPWAGYDAVQERITRTLKWYGTCETLKSRGGPAHPSLHAWDGHRYTPRGIGADSQQVKTEILSDGSRRPLGLDLRAPEGAGVDADLTGAAPWLTPEGAASAPTIPSDFIESENPQTRTGNLICPICEKSVNYDLALSQSKHRARTDLMRHCKQVKTQKIEHRVLLSRVSGRSIAA